ncbi:hypothetical protein [Methanoregula sp.]|uniref:hypothetical protein n=1 Tax=Methanoregula sp. TaxID=2052170 RepID=UPI0035676E5E
MAKCSICADKARKKIDAALVMEGATIRGIAAKFRVSEDALARHVKNGHVLERIAKAQKAQDIVEADALLNEILEIQQHQKTIFQEARDRTIEGFKAPDNKLALEALRDQSKIVELKGKVLGSFVKDVAKTTPAGAAIVAPLTPEAARKIGDIVANSL